MLNLHKNVEYFERERKRTKILFLIDFRKKVRTKIKSNSWKNFTRKKLIN